MSWLLPDVFPLLAASGAVGEKITKFAWDLPETPWRWGLTIGAIVIAVVLIVAVYIRDTSSLHGFWKFWLTTLRLSVLGSCWLALIGVR